MSDTASQAQKKSKTEDNAEPPQDPFLAFKHFHGDLIVPFAVSGAEMLLGTAFGVPVTPLVTQAQVESLSALEPREKDFWICTYLKSGTTLTSEMVKLAMGKSVEDNTLAVAPWVEVAEQVPMVGLPAAVANGIPADEKSGLRFWKSHWTPDRHLASNGKNKFIYVHRDGLDVCISLFHHIRGFPLYNYSGDLNDFFEKFMKGETDFGSWFEHTAQWLRRVKEDKGDVLSLSFRTLVGADGAKKREAEVRKLVNFIGLGGDGEDERVARMLNEARFEQMKARGLLFDKLRSADATPFLRGGRVGDGRRELSADQIARFEAKCKEVFADDLASFEWAVRAPTTPE